MVQNSNASRVSAIQQKVGKKLPSQERCKYRFTYNNAPFYFSQKHNKQIKQIYIYYFLLQTHIFFSQTNEIKIKFWDFH